MAAPGSRGLRIVVVRHAESRWNAAGIYQGQSGPGLSELGRRQAEQVAQHLVTHFPDIVRIDRSDLPRVAETADPTAARARVPVHVEPRLREIDVGQWTGRPHAEIAASEPEGLAAWRAWQDPPAPALPAHGGERFADVRARARAWCTDVVREVAGGTVLAFTHGGVLRVLAGAALGLPPEGEHRLVPAFNASITVLESAGSDLRLVTYNETAHLEACAATGTG